MLQKIDGETPAEHQAFLTWVSTEPPRTLPGVDVANRNRWAARATAFDALTADHSDPKSALRTVLQIEARKLLLRVASAPDGVSVLGVKDLVSLNDLLGSTAPMGAPDAPPDLGEMTTPELETLAKFLARTGG